MPARLVGLQKSHLEMGILTLGFICAQVWCINGGWEERGRQAAAVPLCSAIAWLPQRPVPGTTACPRLGKETGEPKWSRATCVPAAGY